MHREDRQMAKQAPRYSIKPGGSNQHSSSKIYSMGSPGRAVTTHDRSFYEALEPPKVANEVSSAPKSRPKGGVSVEYALENAEELKLNDLQIQALKRLKAERRLQ